MDENIQEQAPVEPVASVPDASAELERVKADLAAEREKARNLNAALREEREKLKSVRDSVEVRREPSDVSVDDIDAAYLAARNYSDEEIDALRPLAKGSGKRLKDVVQLDSAKAIIDWKRSQKTGEAATPNPGRPVVPQAKSEGIKNQQDFEAAKANLRTRSRPTYA